MGAFFDSLGQQLENELRRHELGLGVRHRDEIPWFRAPLPRRLHRCTPWTSGPVDGALVDRCACGAIRIGGRHWFERNSRRPR
jgi:hypothetical protein